MNGVLKFATEKVMNAARDVRNDPRLTERFLKILLRKSRLAAAIREESQLNATARLYSEDVKVIHEVMQAQNVGSRKGISWLEKKNYWATSEWGTKQR